MISASEMRNITNNNGDLFTKKLKEKIEDIESRIKRDAEKGYSETFFTYTQGTVPFNDVRLYEKLKEYFKSNGFKIVKYDTRYNGMGEMIEYAKEYIVW